MDELLIEHKRRIQEELENNPEEVAKLNQILKSMGFGQIYVKRNK